VAWQPSSGHLSDSRQPKPVKITRTAARDRLIADSMNKLADEELNRPIGRSGTQRARDRNKASCPRARDSPLCR
jgi:hypothetical protein